VTSVFSVVKIPRRHMQVRPVHAARFSEARRV